MATKFGGAPKCVCCAESVYKLEEMVVDKSVLHKTCFKCSHCKRLLSLANFASVNSKFYCKTHFIELFHSAGGKYSVFDSDKAEVATEPSNQATSDSRNKSPSVTVARPASPPAAAERSSNQVPLVNNTSTFPASEAPDEDPPSPKYTSLKDRLKQYEQVAGGSSGSRPTSPREGGRERYNSAGSAASNASFSSRGSTRAESTSPPPETLRFKVRGVDPGLPPRTDTDEAKSLREQNKKLSFQVDTLTEKNKQLTALVASLREQLAVQTAKALESDEWVAKISKDYESAQGAIPNRLASFLHKSG